MWFVHVLQGKSELQEAQALLVELNSETRWPQVALVAAAHQAAGGLP